MARVSNWMVILFLLTCHPLVAIEKYTTSTFNETESALGTTVSGWSSGWQQPAVQPTGYTSTTGWNYVGSLAGDSAQASGVYLGNGWVISCAHVGPGTFTLNGVAYPMMPNSAQFLSTTSSGTTTPVDIVLFQVSPAPSLPALPLRTSDPAVSGKFVLIGFGDGGSMTNETWGYNALNYQINQSVMLLGRTSNDFETVNGTDNGTANYEVVGGDSGGANFIYNSALSRWELAGLNEAQLQNDADPPQEVGSAFVQIDTYATQIEQIITPQSPVSEPTMPQWGLILLAGLLCFAAMVARPLRARGEAMNATAVEIPRANAPVARGSKAT